MRIACVAPDDLSIIIFCRTLSRLLAEYGDELVPISSVGAHAKELSEMHSTHIDLGPARYLNPVADGRYLRELVRVLRRGKP